MPYVKYPEIKGANPIHDFVVHGGDVYNIKVGDVIPATDQAAAELKRVFPFLNVYTKEELDDVMLTKKEEKEEVKVTNGLTTAVKKDNSAEEKAVNENESNETEEVEAGKLEKNEPEAQVESTVTIAQVKKADRRELQNIAMDLGVQANLKTEELRAKVIERLK